MGIKFQGDGTKRNKNIFRSKNLFACEFHKNAQMFNYLTQLFSSEIFGFVKFQDTPI